MLEDVPRIHYRTSKFSLQFRTFLESARNEMSLLIRNYNSRVISRIGFISQSMKELDQEISNIIENRAREIGNNECILSARSDLEVLRSEAGNVTNYAATNWLQEFQVLETIAVFPVLSEHEFIVSFEETEFFRTLAYFNSVLSFDQIIYFLSVELTIVEMIFEATITKITEEMIIFDQLTDELNQNLFRKLQSGFELYSTGTSVIREALIYC